MRGLAQVGTPETPAAFGDTVLPMSQAVQQVLGRAGGDGIFGLIGCLRK